MWDPEKTRRGSIAALRPFGIEVLASLPLLYRDDVRRVRPLNQILDRTRALYGVLAVAEGAPIETVRESLIERSLTPWLSERERRFLDACRDGTDTQRERNELRWRTECMLALGWALQLLDELPFTGSQVAPANAFEPIDPKGFGDGSPSSVRLRSVHEIGQRLDLFYCAHWAVRQHELTGCFDPWPADLVGDAIWERRHALEWIFQPDTADWDDVEMST